MRVLVDTCAFLWWATGDQRLSRRALDVLENPESDLVFSVASAWEMALKMDRLGLVEDFDMLLDRATRILRLSIMAVDVRHVIASARLPFHHRDPFDRVLIAQALMEGIPILSVDAAFSGYPVRVIW
jgi:PIN domain nuclease of toxin-antitoxin system